MTVWVDPPRWPGHGRLWSHLISDTSEEELHAFAARLGIPRRGFDADHYDLPEERFDDAVQAGARPVAGSELLKILQGSGLRVPKGKSERLVRWWPDLHDGRAGRMEVLRSGRAVTAGSVILVPGRASQSLGYRRFRVGNDAIILDAVVGGSISDGASLPEWVAELLH